ncbi:hypothetical protein P7K49_029492 [Saguinus oedipus]|uniref:Uncharacterized protein n=1 Tax=Saguinus oedipus TaxID=9490 RepID=A0ABQ9U8K9_SAGOE|nr:hypothetical protein P7K49_029492 [Saguinus oedipus]
MLQSIAAAVAARHYGEKPQVCGSGEKQQIAQGVHGHRQTLGTISDRGTELILANSQKSPEMLFAASEAKRHGFYPRHSMVLGLKLS